MINEFVYYKNAFSIALHPIMDLLDHKKIHLTEKDWIQFIETTKSSVISNPDQFLGQELPSRELLGQAVEEIFNEYRRRETIEI